MIILKYCVLFPKAENVHLIKDVGMFAFKLHKLYGIESYVACLNNGSYPYLDNEVKGLKLDFIEKKYKNEIICGYSYLNRNSKNIDVLQIFHVTLSSVIYSSIYKRLNKNGKIFLKLDCTEELVKKIQALKGIKKIIFEHLFKNANIIGVEQQPLYRKLCELLPQFKEKIQWLPNGIDYMGKINFDSFNYDCKENTFITVGRIGSKEKRIDLMLEAFERFMHKSKENWKLEIIGPVKIEFNRYLEEYFLKYPLMEDKIILKGEMQDRELLFEEYRKAKFYLCTSEYESFGISMLEAAAFGNIILSTDVGIAGELVNEKNGIILSQDNAEKMAECMDALIKDEYIKEKSNNIYDFCKSNYNIDLIVTKLYKKLCGEENE